MITSRRGIQGARALAAGACLLAAGVGRADVEAVDGPCRLKLRSGRIMEARGLQPVDATGAFWRIALEDGNGVVVPLREIKRVEALGVPVASPPSARELRAGDGPADGAACDPATDHRLLRWDSLITESSMRHGIDRDLVRAIVAVESCGDADAVSRKGAIGLMQLLPTTALDYGCADPRDPRANVEAGCRHLARLQAKLGGEVGLVLAAYNAGEGAVARWKGVPRYRETQDYVRNVLAYHARLVGPDPS